MQSRTETRETVLASDDESVVVIMLCDVVVDITNTVGGPSVTERAPKNLRLRNDSRTILNKGRNGYILIDPTRGEIKMSPLDSD